MGKASSAKKVARAARAGSSKRIGRRRNLGFPVMIVVIIVLGVLLVWFARTERQALADPKTTDHWHAAYGIYLCDSFSEPLSDVGTDALGIHTHPGDGVMHVHPFLNSAAGTNAKVGIFFDQVGLEVTNDKIVVPGGETRTEGDDQCDGEDAIVQVAKWDSADAAAAGEKPTQIFFDGFRDIRYTADRQAFTIAFLPEGADIPAPLSIPTLDQLSDVPGATSTTTEGTGSTSSTAPGDTTTTVPGETTTTVPGETTTTVPGETTTTAPTTPNSDTTTTSSG